MIERQSLQKIIPFLWHLRIRDYPTTPLVSFADNGAPVVFYGDKGYKAVLCIRKFLILRSTCQGSFLCKYGEKGCEKLLRIKS